VLSLAVWSRWVEPSTRLGGFRAHKKTPKVPYTTKVNYRKHTIAVELPDGCQKCGHNTAISGGDMDIGNFPSDIYTLHAANPPRSGVPSGLPTCATKRGPQPPRACRLRVRGQYGVLATTP
jgi:hypothetical protein